MRRVLTWTGYTLMMLGVITLLFVVYTLWGTRLQTAAAQRELKEQFQEDTSEVDPAETELAELAQAVEADWAAALENGGPVARIEIPKLGVDSIVVAGTSRDVLRKGPGVLDGTSLPGMPGNATISGHRTTYGAEFNRVDELVSGDQIIITTIAGTTVYEVSGSEVVHPDDIAVTYQKGDNRLTLTTCHPKFSASKRLIISAGMVTGPFAGETPPLAVESSAQDDTNEGGNGND